MPKSLGTTRTRLRCACGGHLKTVSNSRPTVLPLTQEPAIIRRRTCLSCGEKTATIEVPEEHLSQLRDATLRAMSQEIIQKAKR